MNQSKLVITCSWRKAREYVCKPVTIGFGFTSDWIKKFAGVFEPIVWRSNAKRITFDSQSVELF